jgi:nicotinamide-nucleotide amidase
MSEASCERAADAAAALDGELSDLAGSLGRALASRGWRVTAAESCTGGLVAAAITSIAGSSAWFDEGFVTYSNAAKVRALGVPAGTIVAHGAVSEAVVRAMAEGALARANADLAVAITGVAGPGGGTPDKPVGTVWLAWSRRAGATVAELRRFDGDRRAVRVASAVEALRRLVRIAEA